MQQKKVYEKAWMNKVEIAREWVEYKDDSAYPSTLEPLPGYVREARRGLDWEAFDDEYQWPLIDTERYQHFYRDAFFSKPHVNYVSTDQHDSSIGPIIWSVESTPKGSKLERDSNLKVLVQSKKGVERVTLPPHVIDECGGVVPAFKQTLPSYAKLKFEKMTGQLIKDRLLKYEDQIVRNVYKFGVLFCRGDQTEEDEMYNNERGTPAFERFLDFLGDRVKLEGFQGYRGGLDVKTNTTGTHSVHTTHIDDCEIMFHVSTLLQYFPADPQQVERKRHLGNDVVLIVFREHGNSAPFNPKVIRSQFNHIFAVFEEDPQLSTPKAPVYRIELGCKEGVLPFGPDLPNPPLLTTSPKCRKWLLSKLVNSERAAYYAPDFVMKFRNTRKAQLQAIIEESLTAAPKKSLSLGRKTGSHILKGASKMMTARRSKDGPADGSLVISGPRDFRHEAHLDNLGMGGGSFGAVPIMELFMDDYAAGIRPVNDGVNVSASKRLQKTTSFDEKMSSQLVPRSSLAASETVPTKASMRRNSGHQAPTKPLPPPVVPQGAPQPTPASSSPSSTPLSSAASAAESPKTPPAKLLSPRKRETVRSAHYGLSPLVLDKPRSGEESKLNEGAEDRSAGGPGWVVGTFQISAEEEEAEAELARSQARDRQSGPPPKPGGVGAMPHKPKRAADMAFERPSKPPPPPPGGSDAKPGHAPRRRPKPSGEPETEKKSHRHNQSDADGVRFSSGGKHAEPNGSDSPILGSHGRRKRSISKDNGTPDDEIAPKQTSWEVPSDEKRKARPPPSPRGERGEDRIGRRKTLGSSNNSPRSRPSVHGAFDSATASSSSPKSAVRKNSSPRGTPPE